ncbi:MAG: mono/diheme cytochrome c family protein, partial [Planctomycetota bacterium]
RIVALSVILGAAVAQSAPTKQGLASVDFTRQVRPILSQHCFACHGPDREALEAELSLVTFEEATAARDDGAAVTPKSRQASLLWQRINDTKAPMPPSSAHNTLTDEQIEILGRWIDEGASYAPHWAYVPPARTESPAVRETEWPLGDVDHYVLARLEAAGLAHAAAADPATLLRRLTLDLTGLPPSASDVDSFLAAYKSDPEAAYMARVDRLLASPHYGERMATPWLDLVRYADTVGYHGDQEHRVWPYREWVIRAFQNNMPFDQFTIEQLAGDLLPDPTQQQLVATGYNRLLQTTHEGGLQLAEYRAIYLADRVRNASAVWMGATVGCAQCHDHKYDPYTARDFYAFGAFFADIDDEEHLRNPYGGLNSTPTMRAPEMRVADASAEQRAEAIAQQRGQVESELKKALAALPEERAKWQAELLAEVATGSSRQEVWVDDALETGGEVSGAWKFVAGNPQPHSGTRSRVQAGGGTVQHYTKETKKRIEVAAGDVFYAWVHLDRASPTKAVMLQFHVNGDWPHRAVWGGDTIAYGRKPESWAGYRRMGALPAAGEWACLEVDAASIGLKPGDVVSGWAFTQSGGKVHWDDAGVRTSVASEALLDALRTPPGSRDDPQRALLAQVQQRTAPSVVAARSRLASLESAAKKLRESLPATLFTRALEKPRTVKVLPRGNWLDDSGAVVAPAVPAFLGKVAAATRASRLDLARWLVTKEQHGGVGGMSARVFVNRTWAMLFGTGLCPSPEDFGGQGKPPNHVALLDLLALDFIDSGWDIKALVRRMVLTRAYRQASVAKPGVVTRDPLNEFYARQSRQRLPAEMVRDIALVVSGLLVDRVGGESAKPPQPAGYYRHLNFPVRKYRTDMDQDRWRRGVYVHWQRQFLHPMLRAFDAPTREECTAQRPISNTPLAALTLLNDPVFVEASRAFAQRALLGPAKNDRARIAWAMREATARWPKTAEVDVLLQLLRASRTHYKDHPDAAAALLKVGASPRAKSLPVAEHAAWTQLTRTILNLHETICRD